MTGSTTHATAGQTTAQKRLAGKVALVTGASRGIGRGIAEGLGREGADVVVLARDETQIQEVARGVREGGVKALALRCDVTSEDETQASARAALDEFGKIDVLINNAGIGKRGKVDEISVQDWDQMFAVNLRGVFLMTRAVVPAMKKNGGGHIVNISSVAGLVGNAGLSGYNATKFGLMGFSEAIMLELRHDRIKVTTVNPGSTDSYFGSATQGASGRENFLSVDDVTHAVIEVVATAPNSLISQVHIRPLVPPKRG